MPVIDMSGVDLSTKDDVDPEEDEVELKKKRRSWATERSPIERPLLLAKDEMKPQWPPYIIRQVIPPAILPPPMGNIQQKLFIYNWKFYF